MDSDRSPLGSDGSVGPQSEEEPFDFEGAFRKNFSKYCQGKKSSRIVEEF